jgi:molybdate transport system ATP-binding protein
VDKSIISLQNVSPVFAPRIFSQPINWTIKEGEHWAVVGQNGAGKSRLIDIVMGKTALRSGEIQCVDNLKISEIAKYVAFTNIYTFVDVSRSYYQQRWNTGDQQTAPFVRDVFARADAEEGLIDKLLPLFGVDKCLGKRINMLSSGELRKTLLVLSLLSKPRVLIVDNPYIGLDAKSRGALSEMFESLAHLDKVQIVSVVSTPSDLPPITTHVLPIKDGCLLPSRSREDFLKDEDFIGSLFGKKFPDIAFPSENESSAPDFKNVLIFNNVRIKYGERTILENLNWTLCRGEKWLLQGDNGSGKSTLLSLIFCDNPQSYANDITLFDRRRGVGQSIWEVKSRIGFVSPELTTYYRKNITCLEVVASGFFDTIGSPRSSNARQRAAARQWLRLFGIEHLQEISFLNVSTGERQLVLLARAFVKEPDLLIMDEPLHGLDVSHKIRVNELISSYCSPQKSLIYVTHYDDEIPPIINYRMKLEKRG